MVAFSSCSCVFDNRSCAPKLYADSERSGLTANIAEATDVLDSELTWAGVRPLVEQISAGGKE